jgi:hypothetical protein
VLKKICFKKVQRLTIVLFCQLCYEHRICPANFDRHYQLHGNQNPQENPQRKLDRFDRVKQTQFEGHLYELRSSYKIFRREGRKPKKVGR